MPDKKNIKTVCLKIIKWLVIALLLLLSPVIFILLYFIFDDVGYCAEHGGVWDYNQDICRHDCLAWTKKRGCIPHGSKVSAEELLKEAQEE